MLSSMYDQFSIQYDGLKKVAGHSALGEFHYVPVLFSQRRRISKIQRTLLEVLGLLLSRNQEVRSNGVIFHGSDCRSTVVRFTAGLQAAQKLAQGR